MLIGEGHGGAIYHATGPAAVDGAARAALLSEIAGKPVRFVALDEAQFRGGMRQAGLREEYVDAVVDIEKRFVAGDFDIVTGDVGRLAGRTPSSLADVLAKRLAAITTGSLPA
jgi:NAD(P)H dehydrogenase (quinone)